MRNWNNALKWKMADRFPELSESDLNMKIHNWWSNGKINIEFSTFQCLAHQLQAQSRSQSFVPLDQRAVGKRELWEHPFSNNNGNNRIPHIDRISSFTAQSASMVSMAHAWNGCSQSSRFPTAGQGERSSGNVIVAGRGLRLRQIIDGVWSARHREITTFCSTSSSNC